MRSVEGDDAEVADDEVEPVEDQLDDVGRPTGGHVGLQARHDLVRGHADALDGDVGVQRHELVDQLPGAVRAEAGGGEVVVDEGDRHLLVRVERRKVGLGEGGGGRGR
jgi:hypothetical protein